MDPAADPIALVFDTDVEPDGAMWAICEEFRNSNEQIASLTFGRRSQHPMLECADLCAGSNRYSWLAGGPMRGPFEWFHASHAKRHVGTFWSLEQQQKMDEALAKRKEHERRRERDGEG
jgi:hypothetical protein